jgi:hypothetical protein
MPETAELSRGALASLRPRVRVPAAALGTFASITPVNIAAWALGGFYFSLMPAVVRVATGAPVGQPMIPKRHHVTRHVHPN